VGDSSHPTWFVPARNAGLLVGSAPPAPHHGLPGYAPSTLSMMSAIPVPAPPPYALSQNPYTNNPMLKLKDVSKLIMTRHFSLNPNTLLTEKAGKVINGQFTPRALSWLFNPLLAYSALTQSTAALFFPPLPIVKQLTELGFQGCSFSNIVKIIKQMFSTGLCNFHLQDIQHLPVQNLLYFAPTLQSQVITALEYHHSAIHNTLEAFAAERFTEERDYFMQLQHTKITLPAIILVKSSNQTAADISLFQTSHETISGTATSQPNYKHIFRNMILSVHQHKNFTRNMQKIMSTEYHMTYKS
jgi:hypothetical protein